MIPFEEFRQQVSRRFFLSAGSHLLGGAALASLTGKSIGRQHATRRPARHRLPHTHFAPKAKQVIYLHMVGGPSQMDLFDYKPVMREWFDKDLPESVRMGQRLTTMTSGQARFPIAPSMYQFERCGQSGMWISELLPNLKKSVDDLVFIRSMHTEAINHEPAITLMQSGNQITGRPCLGAWASYGLGSLNDNLPTFVVMVAKSTNVEQVQAISARLWSSGFLPGTHAGVSLRTAGDPILYINDPPGVSRDVRRASLDGVNALNELNYQQLGDPQTQTRIQQYELAYRMQASVPELTDIASEPESTYKLYGDEAKKPGTFANTALLARRMVERGVRFVQIYHNNWDTHAQRRRPLADAMQRRRSTVPRAHRRSEAARHARRNARRLGRRIRPHDLLARRPLGPKLRPRSSPALLHDVDGRRRLQRRHGARRDRRLLVQHHQRPGPRPRFPRDGAAPTRLRPRALHVQEPGSRSETHRRAPGPRRKRNLGVSRPRQRKSLSIE